MTLAVRAVFWAVAYLGAAVSPLVFAALGASDPARVASAAAER